MWLEILLLVILLCFVFYRFMTRNFGKWKQVGIPHSTPKFPFGSYDFASGQHLDVLSAEDHKKFADEKYFGWFLLGKPVLAINDVNLIKQIQVKDFDHFVDRTSDSMNKKMFSGGDLDEIWLLQLTSLTGDAWKEVRSAFTPIFTSGKMKSMLKFIKHVAEDLSGEMGKKAEEGEEFDLKDVFGKFSLDALASSAFGVNADSFQEKDSIFVKYAANINKSSALENLLLFLKFLPGVSKLFKLFKINGFKPKETKFFRDIILQTIRTRRDTKERKNDLIDLMLDCIKEDTKEDPVDEPTDQYEKDMKLTTSNKSKHSLDEITVVATALVLLIAGYDTTGNTLSFLAYEMSKNEEIQKKLQDEIDEAFEESGEEFPDYSVIQNLPYLDMVVYETLRLHSPVGVNFRVANKDYTIPGTDIVLKAEDMISFNTKGLHFDPEHWTNPTEFYPEHFSKESKAERSPYAFQAFGQGPRACLGMRFAVLEAKVAVIALLRKFSFKPGTKTEEPFVFSSDNQLAWPKGGLWARVEMRNQSE